MSVHSPQELLGRHGIAWISTIKGKYTTECPQCSGGYLNVKVNGDSVEWYCHHCREGGGEQFEQADGLGPIKAVYDYTDESGKLLFQALRFEPVNGPKQFRQRTGPDQDKWSIKGVRIVPYRLPELLADLAAERVVFVVEGEKDVDTLRRHGVPATCNPMGAGKWWPEFNTILKGADVVICGDNDEPGREHVKLVTKELHGVVSGLRILDLRTIWPDIEESDDVSDWFAAGGTVEELWAAVEKIPRGEAAATLTEVATAYGHCTSDRARETVEHVIREGLPGRSAGVGFSPHANKDALVPSSDWRENTVTAAELRTMNFEPVRYVVPEYVPEGVTLLIGRPKIGKSWLALDVAVACASDRSVLGSLKPVHGDVLNLALEDSKRRLQRRLDKRLSPFRGEWPKRLRFAPMGEWRRADQGGLEDIEAWCNSVTKPVLVVIDTLERFRKPADGRQQLYAADTQAIASLQKIAIKCSIAILVLHHDRKAEADDPFDTVSGTLGLTGAADTILILKRQNAGVVLHARGRDIEESETALQFDKATCRWSILGEASAVHRSAERKLVIAALAEAGGPLSVGEIMAEVALERNAADLLLGRMARNAEIERVGRGKYALPAQTANERQIGQKERSDQEAVGITGQTGDLSNLSDLSENDLEPGGEAVL
jgi:hypothetical protein